MTIKGNRSEVTPEGGQAQIEQQHAPTYPVLLLWAGANNKLPTPQPAKPEKLQRSTQPSISIVDSVFTTKYSAEFYGMPKC